VRIGSETETRSHAAAQTSVRVDFTPCPPALVRDNIVTQA